MADSAGLAQALNAELAQRALQYATPATIPFVQRSAYLADALQQMRQHGGDNIKTPLALGTNLLADALDQIGYRKANRQLATQQQADMGTAAQYATMGLPNPMQAQPAPPGGMAPTSAPMVPSAPQGAPMATPATASATPKVPIDPQSRDLLARLLVTEAGDSPQDEAATGSVVLNRAQMSDQPISSVITAPHQFEGLSKVGQVNPGSDAYQRAASIVDQLSQSGPVGPWDHFYSPKAQAALGRPKPAWDDGTGQPIGGQMYFAQGYGGKPPFAQSNAPGPNQSTATAAQAPPSPMPAQISTGPDPSVPSPQAQGPSGASPFAVQNPAPSPPPGAAASPPGPQGPGGLPAQLPHGQGPTPYEWQRIQALINSQRPALVDQGIKEAQVIQQRYGQPLEADPKMMWQQTPQGWTQVPKPGESYRQLQGQTPSDAAQMDPFGQISHTAIPGMQGAVPEGKVYANGQYVTVQGGGPQPLTDPAERARWGILPSDRNSYAIGADGKPFKTADNPYGPKEIQSVHDNFWNSDETKKAQEGYSAFQGISNVLGNMATANNGVLDTAAVDSYLRGINPGMGARNTTVNMFLTHLGLPQEVMSHIESLTGNGYLTPETLKQMVQVTHDYALAHQQSAMARAQADAKMVAPYGYGAQDLAEQLPPLGPMPQVRFGVSSSNGPPPAIRNGAGSSGLGGLLAPQVPVPGSGGGAVAPNNPGNAGGGGFSASPALAGPAGASAGASYQDLQNEARRRGLIR